MTDHRGVTAGRCLSEAVQERALGAADPVPAASVVSVTACGRTRFAAEAGARRRSASTPARPAIDPVLRVQRNLTARDHTIIAWLGDHGVLTTSQVAFALFPSADVAQRRLRLLTEMGLLQRFRPLKLDGGSYPFHYVIDHLGGARAGYPERRRTTPAGPVPRPDASADPAG